MIRKIFVWCGQYVIIYILSIQSYMNRRNTRKSDSFDFLRIQPKKKSNIIEYHISYQGDTLASNLEPKQKKCLELPKIVLAKRSSRQILYQQSKLLMRGSRLKNQIEQQFKDYTISMDQPLDESMNNASVWIKRKRSTKENYPSRDFLISSILMNHQLSQIYFLRKNKIKTYVEEGNNSRLIKELLRKRICIKLVSDKKDANIVWTRFLDWEYYVNFPHLTKYTQFLPESSSSQTDSTEIQQSTKDLPCNNAPFPTMQINQLKIHNHFQHHYEISDKKCLLNNIKAYCKKIKMDENYIIPITYHVKSVEQMESGKNDKRIPQEIGSNGDMWVVKPGEDSNRGNDIKIVIGRQAIIEAVKKLTQKNKTAIIQQYIQPLLYKNRKFDLRCYVLVTSIKGVFKAYWYKEGYIRTCSKEFTYDPNSLFSHLTNDAIQKSGKQYGKYEQSNKLSFSDLEAYLKTLKQIKINMYQLCEKMKELAKHSLKSVENKIKSQENTFCFQIFGYDFLIDKDGKVWLIEVNTNPCLQFTGSLTSRIIWHMMENSIRIALDPIIAGNDPDGNLAKDEHDFIFDENKYEVII